MKKLAEVDYEALLPLLESAARARLKSCEAEWDLEKALESALGIELGERRSVPGAGGCGYNFAEGFQITPKILDAVVQAVQ